jgi:hypothetical protein
VPEPAERRGLTDFQLEVARSFFALPASDGFLLAGGGALLANGLTDRPTQDLDFFRSSPDVVTARDAFEAAAVDRGWRVARLRDHDDFVRLQVEGTEPLIVDLCLDSPPTRPAVATVAGPTFDPAELAGRKVVALFPGFRSCDRGVGTEMAGEQARWGLCACACSAYAS